MEVDAVVAVCERLAVLRGLPVVDESEIAKLESQLPSQKECHDMQMKLYNEQTKERLEHQRAYEEVTARFVDGVIEKKIKLISDATHLIAQRESDQRLQKRRDDLARHEAARPAFGDAAKHLRWIATYAVLALRAMDPCDDKDTDDLAAVIEEMLAKI